MYSDARASSSSSSSPRRSTGTVEVLEDPGLRTGWGAWTIFRTLGATEGKGNGVSSKLKKRILEEAIKYARKGSNPGLAL